MAAADASLGSPIEGPAEWSGARECDQTASGLTPKAQRTWDRHLGKGRSLPARRLTRLLWAPPGERPQLSRRPSPPGWAGYRRCVETRAQSLSGTAGFTGPPRRVPAQTPPPL